MIHHITYCTATTNHGFDMVLICYCISYYHESSTVILFSNMIAKNMFFFSPGDRKALFVYMTCLDSMFFGRGILGHNFWKVFWGPIDMPLIFYWNFAKTAFVRRPSQRSQTIYKIDRFQMCCGIVASTWLKANAEHWFFQALFLYIHVLCLSCCIWLPGSWFLRGCKTPRHPR